MKHFSILLLAIIIFGVTAESQDASHFFPEKDLVTTGIYY